MRAVTHHIFGAYAGVVAGTYVFHLPLPSVVIAGTAASVFAGGFFSPDTDQYRWWRWVDKKTPDERLGQGGPLRHRGLSHWWGLPAAASGLLWWLDLPLSWLLWMVVIGWTSHLVGDLVFGKASPYDHRGPGIPMAPWWGHVGVGLGSAGWVEKAVNVILWTLPVVVLLTRSSVLMEAVHTALVR